MDWARAKSILIFIFILLNIFLSAILIKVLNDESVIKETILNTRQALAGRGVVLECDIPHNNRNMGNLTYQDTDINREMLVKNIFGNAPEFESLFKSNNIKVGYKELEFLDEYAFIYKNSKPENEKANLNNFEGILDYVVNILNGTKIPVLDYQLDQVEISEDGKKNYFFKQKYKEFWVHENYITVSTSSDGITHIECRYRKIKSIINGKSVMPAYQVLIKNHKTIKDIIITKIDIGYKERKMEDGTRELDDIPVWRVQVQNKEKKYNIYFKAYDGEQIE